MAAAAFNAPLEAHAVAGEVVLTAPLGAASIALTPEAALETANRLEAAARTALFADDCANEA